MLKSISAKIFGVYGKFDYHYVSLYHIQYFILKIKSKFLTMIFILVNTSYNSQL